MARKNSYALKNLFVIRDLTKEKKWGEPRIYWCADGVGYTPEIEDAGRWTKTEATMILGQEPERLKVVSWENETAWK